MIAPCFDLAVTQPASGVGKEPEQLTGDDIHTDI